MDKYYKSKKFKEILSDYELKKQQGQGFYMDLDDLMDITDYYAARGEANKAYETAMTARDIFPDADAPLIFLSRYELAEHQDLEKAKQIADRVEDKSDEEYILLRAELMICEGKVDESEKYLQNKFGDENWDTDFDDLCIDAAGLYADYNLFSDAGRWLRHVSDTEDSEYKELMAEVLMASGHYEDSMKLWNELLNDDPFSVDNWNSLAQSQFMLDQLNDSVSSSDYSLAIEPDNVDALINKANALFTLGNYEEAYEYYARYSAVEPNNPVGYLFAGLALINVGRNEEGLSLLQKAAKLSGAEEPHLPEVYQEIAVTLCTLHRTDEAHKYLDKAKEDGLDATQLYLARAYVYLTEGETRKAWDVFNTLLKRSNYSIDVFKQIAMTYVDCGYVRMGAKLIKSIFAAGETGWYEGYAYMARCGYYLHDGRMMADNLKVVCSEKPQVAWNLLSDLFPPNTPPEEYPDMVNNILDNNYKKRK